MKEDKSYLSLKGDTNYWLKHLQLLNVGRVARLLSKKDKEIERLNNIINELEKWLEENGKQFIDEYGYIKSNDKMIYIDDIFDKLKELKGSDKE